MTVLYTDSNRFSDVVNYEFEPAIGYCRDAVVINDVAATLPVGTVLGKVTSTGKYKVALLAATDGSQVPAAVLLANTIGESFPIPVVLNTDTKAVAMTRGMAILKGANLVLGTGITLATVKTAFAALNPPILVEAVI
jgi:hypothetical protein